MPDESNYLEFFAGDLFYPCKYLNVSLLHVFIYYEKK